MRADWILALACLLIAVSTGPAPAATVGSPNMVGFALAGAGETAPQEGTDYPDFIVKGARNYSYLLFGGPYSSANWTGWGSQTYYLKFGYSTADDGLWLGFAVGAALDVTGDGDNDVLIGDINYLDVNNPASSQGKTWLIHDVVYTTSRPSITLTATQGIDCDMTEISSSQAQNWFGCSMGSAGNLDEADYDGNFLL